MTTAIAKWTVKKKKIHIPRRYENMHFLLSTPRFEKQYQRSGQSFPS
jgi:hypothetical protein